MRRRVPSSVRERDAPGTAGEDASVTSGTCSIENASMSRISKLIMGRRIRMRNNGFSRWHRAKWTVIAVLGYVLSPLSWWNDLYVNLPIAYAIANLAHRLNARLFLPTFLLTYWLTNAAGLLLLHIGASEALRRKLPSLNKPTVVKWAVIALGYAAVVVVLYRCGILRPLTEYSR